MNEKRLKEFGDTYRVELRTAIIENPQMYRYGVDRVDAVSDMMVAAIRSKGYTKDGVAFQSTCKRLGINGKTYKAINEYFA